MHSLGNDVLDVLREYGHEGIEIEWRLGRHLDGTFHPGIPEGQWKAMLQKCESIQDVRVEKSSTIEHITHDHRKKIVHETGEVTWMSKHRLATFDANPDFRVSIAQECPLEPLPDPAEGFSHTRHKRRTSFFYKIWRLDFTQVTSNDPTQLDHDTETYEMELELISASSLFAYTTNYICDWATHFLNELRRT